MIRLFAQARKKLLSGNRLTRYLTYAFGEILLIVIGILIALEISNANQEKLDASALKGYLQSISKNIESDLRKAQVINNNRISLRPKIKKILIEKDREYLNYFRSDQTISNQELKYSPELVGEFSTTLRDIWSVDYLSANTSGFDSMKSAGFLSKLQGTDLEDVLLQYYNIVSDITRWETTHNESIHNSQNSFINANLVGSQVIFTPSKFHWTGEQQVHLSRAIFDILNHPSLAHTIYSPDYLISSYENLLIVGTELRRMIESDLMTFDDQAKRNLANVHDYYSGIGYAKILQEGTIIGGYGQGHATAESNKFFLDVDRDDYINLNFVEQAWGAFFIFAGSSTPDPKVNADYSVYQFIRIEMRGASGGENIQISLKDSSNPADGSETKVPLTLSKEWQYYEIPLSSFHPTDLSELFMVVGFVFEKDASNIHVRNIEYVR